MAEEKETTVELLKAIKDKLSELEDTQLVNKLDIINMKNELDKMSLTSAPTPETTEKISELAHLAEKSEKFKRMESAIDDIERLKAELEKSKPTDTEALKLEMSNLKKHVSGLEAAPPGKAPAEPGLSKEISKIKKEVGNIKASLEKGGGKVEGAADLSARLEELERSVEISAASKSTGAAPQQVRDLLKRIERLESAPPPKGAKPAKVAVMPPGLKSDVEDLKERLASLERAPPVAKGGGADARKLQDLARRIEKAESRPPASAPAAVPPGIRAEIGAIKVKMEELAKARPPAQRPAAVGPMLKAEILDRLAKLEARRVVPAGRLPAKARADLLALAEKVSMLEKRRPPAAAPAPKLPADIQAKLRRIDGLSSDIESLRAMLAAPGAKARGAGREKAPPALPPGFMKRIGAIERSVMRLDLLKPGVKEMKSALSNLEKRVAKLAEQEPGPSVEEVESMLENVRASMTDQGKEILDLHQEDSKRIDDYVKKMELIEHRLAGAKDKANAAELDEIRADLQVLNATVPRGLPAPDKLASMLHEFAEIKSRMGDIEKEVGENKPEAGTGERLDSIANEVSVLKTKLTGMEQTVAGVGLAPVAMEDQFPIEEFTRMKERMLDLEKALAKTSKLAASLKPIELPEKAGEKGSKVSPELEKKVVQLQKMIGEGVTPARIRELEARMEEIKSRLPEEIGKGTETKLQELRKQMESKLKELEDVKRDIVESSLDQLLAQPGNLGKLVDKKLADDVRDLKEKVEKMVQKTTPADAKLTAILKESDDRDREIEKMKAKVKELEETAGKGFEDLEVEVKAMTSKLGSMHGSVKGMEEAGTAGVMRDLEILKTKAEWLESTVQKFDLKPLYARLEELEDMMRTGRGSGSGPMVIE
jgi:hypothetical protein